MDDRLIVWILEGTTPYERVYELEIFKTEEQAEKRLKEIRSNTEYEHVEDWEISSYEVE